MRAVGRRLLPLLLAALLAGCAATPAVSDPPAPAAADGPAVYETQVRTTQRDGQTIYGVLYLPQGAGDGEALPAVIFSHGFGGTHAVGTPYAQALAQAGYVVYCFDFCGGSPSSQSDGSPLEMSLFTQQADLEAVIAMVQALPFVDGDNLFLMGTSQGGAVSAITGAAHREAIRGMVLLYPAFVLVENAQAQFAQVGDIPETVPLLGMTVGRAYFAPLLDYDIYEAIAAYDRDVLLLHGSADTLVPLSASQRALAVYPSARLEVLPGAGHGFSGADFQQAVAWTVDYLQAHRIP